MNEPNGDNFYPLDDDTISLLQDGARQIELLQARLGGVLQLYIRQRKLEGNWKVCDNGREIQRVLDLAPAAS